MSYYNISLILLGIGAAALVMFASCFIYSLWKDYPEAPDWVKTSVSVLITIICVVCVALTINYASSEMQNTHRHNTERDQAISQNQQLIKDQMEQIKRAYDMPGLNMEPTPCTSDTPTRKVEASWPGGYGHVIIGKAAGNYCQVDIFDETGKKLQPVR